VDRPFGLQEVENPKEFLNSQHMKGQGYQPYAPAAYTSQKITLALISVKSPI
jgi:hypothetical protein